MVLITCFLSVLIETADAKSRDDGDRGASYVTPATLDQCRCTRGREQVDEVKQRLKLAQRADEAQPVATQPAGSGPAAAGSRGARTATEQRRAADAPAHETTSTPLPVTNAVQAVSEAERLNQNLLLDQERQRANKLARELAAARVELDAARQTQTHTVRAIEIGIQQTQALEQEREKTDKLSRELSFLKAELDVSRVAASKAMQAPEPEPKQERPVDRRNGAKRFALELASLRSELEASRSAASEATKSAAVETAQRQALERELKQEQDKTEALISEVGTLRIAASETAKASAADVGQRSALTRELEKQRGRAESGDRLLHSLQAELRAARTASSELAAGRAADAEQKLALKREAEEQRGRADALAREAASLKDQRDLARAEKSEAIRAVEAAAKAEAKREKEQPGNGAALLPTFASVRDHLAAWNASAVVAAPSREPSSRAPNQSSQPTASLPSAPSASASMQPSAQIAKGTALPGPNSKAKAAAERQVAASGAQRPLANEERLLARASALLRQADINGARGLLEYVLGHGSAQAAFMLAETYDPHMLQSWDARGVAGDSAKARELYERAQVGGIHDAEGRIKGLK
ncbi:hypothetical protein [Bradyrhizobium liaoningense]|uniref:hypothetical protein n=1 Tax=Bradyrhizobium liaoningense TaxID=43992 RepID=UPI001BA78F98|nr:hypothetical protein [Bradyrhizobium liaoningense]MBR0816798.1 hypothetical protein [Bradyrhizobium liaoningense]